MTVVECHSAEEARREIERFRFDLIFIDLLIPGEPSGYDLCKALKEDERTKEIPIFLFCDHRLPPQVVFGYFSELKAQRFIVPPFDPVKLCDQIRFGVY